MATIGSLTLDLIAEVAGFRRDLDKAQRDLNSATARMNRALASVEREFQRVNRAARAAGIAIGGFAAADAVRNYVRLADAAKTLENQLRLVTSSSDELRRVQDRLFASAQRTHSGFQGTVDLYARLARSTTDLGISSERLLRVTETVNQAVALSATTAGAAEAALFQLGQGLAAGALRGEELNSILEQTPRLAEAIADGLGVSTAELRRLGQEGELSAGRVLAALENQARAVQTEFGKVDRRVSDAMTQVRNEVLRVVGQFDRAQGSTKQLVAALDQLRFTVADPGFINALHLIGNGFAYIAQQAANVVTGVGQMASALSEGDWAGTVLGYFRASPFQNADEILSGLGRRLGVLDESSQGGVVGNWLRRQLIDPAAEAAKALEEAREELIQLNTEFQALGKPAPGASSSGGEISEEMKRQLERRQEVIDALRGEWEELSRLNDATLLGEDAVRALNVELEIEQKLREAGIDTRRRLTAEEERAVEVITRTVRANAELRDSIEETERARQKAREALEEQQRAYESTVDRIVDYGSEKFADLFSENGANWRDMLDDMWRTTKATFARIASEMVLRPVIAPIVAGLTGFTGSTAVAATFGGGIGGIGGGLSVGNLLSGGSSLSSLLSGSTMLADIGRSFATSSVGQWLGLSKGIAKGGAVLTNAGSLLSQGLSYSPWGIIGSLGASLLGLGGGLGGTIGGTIGSIAGGAAGSSLLGSALGAFAGPLGAIAGGVLGSALGGLLGGKPSDGAAWTTVNANTGRSYGYGDLGSKTKDETRQYLSGLTSIIGQVGAALRTAGATSLPELYLHVGTRDGLRYRVNGGNQVNVGADSDAYLRALMQALIKNASGLSSSARTALGHVDLSDTQAILEAVDFANFYDSLVMVKQELSPAEQALKDLAATFDEARAGAREYGLSVAALNKAQQRAVEEMRKGFDEGIADQILAITDPMALALKQLDEEFAIIRRDAIALGGDLVQVEKLYGLQRKQIIEQYAQQMSSSLRRLLDELTASTSSPLAPTVALANAEARFAELQQRALGGDTSVLSELEATARNLLDLSRQVYASSDSYFQRYDLVVATLRQLLGDLPGFATGGSFRVGGSGLVDSKLIAFRATPGELVDVRKPGQASNDDQVASLLQAIGREITRGNVKRSEEMDALIKRIGSLEGTVARQQSALDRLAAKARAA